MSRPDLVIFDCDGVLVDSEALANERMAVLFTGWGLPITGPECRRRFQGMMMEDVCRDFAALTGRPHDPALPDIVRAEVEAVLAESIEPVPGAVALVGRLIAEAVPICVASSGTVAKMRLTLGAVGLLPQLGDRLFSAQDVALGKPHPDVFLAAAAAMGFRCEDAVVIEDSPTGVRAAVASGARVLGYAGDPFTDAAALVGHGAEVIRRMDQVPALIGLE